MSFYEKKAAFHFKQWELSMDLGEAKSADIHMVEYNNYQEMIKMEQAK